MANQVAPRDRILQYLEATVVGGLTKKEAYTRYVDGTVKDVHKAISRLEKRQEFLDLQEVISSDANYRFKADAQRVRGKYLSLIEKNIDKAGDVLDNATDLKDKAKAVRLANETIQAMAIVAGPSSSDDGGQTPINKASVIS